MAKKAKKTSRAAKKRAPAKAKRKPKPTRHRGLYSEYLDAKFSAEQLTKERKKQLARIVAIRRRDVFVYAADPRKHHPPHADTRIIYEDLVPINDQLSVLAKRSVDVILETPGGLAEYGEDIVKLLRTKFSRVGFIVPGRAMSAGTIMVMSGDEILMEPASSLGPIDPQITWQGKVFSAHAFLEGFQKIKGEVDKTNKLNRAYIPMLQSISPGEIQACENAQRFSRSLVSRWLQRYKFSRWRTHSQTGAPVTDEEKKARAEEIADKLSDHSRWLTHGRSVKIEHLREMGLRIVDYSKRKELCDAIRRYHILLQMTFAGSVYKLFETPTSQIMRHLIVSQPQQRVPSAGAPNTCEIEIECPECHTKTKLQANLGSEHPIRAGLKRFPRDNRFRCPTCGAEQPLDELRRDIEGQSKLPIV